MVQIWSVGGCGLAWFNPGPDLFYGQVGTGCFDGRVTAHEVCMEEWVAHLHATVCV
jgi:hypothetical protein